jgi:hypothetical protein
MLFSSLLIGLLKSRFPRRFIHIDSAVRCYIICAVEETSLNELRKKNPTILVRKWAKYFSEIFSMFISAYQKADGSILIELNGIILN